MRNFVILQLTLLFPKKNAILCDISITHAFLGVFIIVIKVTVLQKYLLEQKDGNNLFII